ncbi:peroxidase [Sarracenia purpurea var. burkii]
MGKARCVSFRQRIYEESPEEDEQTHHQTRRRGTLFRRVLRSLCPKSGRDGALAPLDLMTPARFDNRYFHNIIRGEGLLESDNVLVSQDVEGEIRRHVWAYAGNQELFFASFRNSMIKMGSINVLAGDEGQIRRNCRFVNT